MASGTVTVFASGTAADGALTGWVNATNAYSDDGTPATRTGTNKNEWYGQLYSFDLSTLPSVATIGTVTLTAEWMNSAVDTSGPEFLLNAQSNGTLVGSGSTDTTGGTVYELVTYQPTNLDAAALRTTGASGFWGVVRFRRTDNTAHAASLDYVKVDVVYNLIYNITMAEGSQAQASDTAQATFSSPPVNVSAQEDTQSQSSDLIGATPIYLVSALENNQGQSSDLISASFSGASSFTPICAVLDNFNRANENPLTTTTWGGAFGAGQNTWKIVSNMAVPA